RGDPPPVPRIRPAASRARRRAARRRRRRDVSPGAGGSQRPAPARRRRRAARRPRLRAARDEGPPGRRRRPRASGVAGPDPPRGLRRPRHSRARRARGDPPRRTRAPRDGRGLRPRPPGGDGRPRRRALRAAGVRRDVARAVRVPRGRAAARRRAHRGRARGAGRRRARAPRAGRRRGRAGRGPRAPARQRRAPCATRSGRARAGAGALLRCAAGRGARNPLRAPPRGMKVSVLAFDLSDNATGRADLLARLLAPRYEVEVVGPRFGDAVWRPARDGAVRYRALPAARWPRFDRAAARARLGVGDARVVMFLGTPRGHKGVEDLVEATAGLDAARLVLVGANADRAAARRWAARGHVKVVGEIPFDDVPRYLVAADVVAVPQRATTDTLGQVPAKLFDAMALGRPIVSTAVSMIPEILEGCGVLVRPGDTTAL